MFEGQRIILTGGGSGIGRAAALKFGDAGARLLVGDINRDAAEETAAIITSAGGNALAAHVDVTDSASVTRFFDVAGREFGGLDIGINNAGIAGRPGGFCDIDEAGFDAVVTTNLKGVWLCMRAELLLLRQAGRGVIVNTASAFGLVGGAGSAAYAASKHGIVGLTKSAALEYSAHGIRVNAVCPGVVRTPLLEGAHLAQEALDALAALHPIGRLGLPEDVAEAIIWLASPASAFVTGASLAVDGGWTAG